LTNGTDRITDLQSGDWLSFNTGGGAPVVFDTKVQSGDVTASLGKGQVMVGAFSGGVTKIYVGTDVTAGADLTIDLQGNYSAGDFTLSNNSFDTALNYGPGLNLSGTAGADSLVGGNGADTLTGLDGNDSLTGNGGNDSLDGGNQNDQLRGESGNDTIVGGDGNDYITGGSGDDNINGGAGAGDTADYFFSDTTAAIP
jgi:Ca2+-binding RTX toxin-like protein